MGVIKEYTSTDPLSDFNSLTTTGRYTFKNDAAINQALNRPSGVSLHAPAYLDVFQYGYNTYQRLTALTGSSGNYVDAIFERVKGAGSVYSNWQRIDNYGTSSLSDFASALGAFLYRGKYNSYSQDTLTDEGVYAINGTDASTALGDDGILFIAKRAGDIIVKVKIGATSGKIAVKNGNHEWAQP